MERVTGTRNAVPAFLSKKEDMKRYNKTAVKVPNVARLLESDRLNVFYWTTHKSLRFFCAFSEMNCVRKVRHLQGEKKQRRLVVSPSK